MVPEAAVTAALLRQGRLLDGCSSALLLLGAAFGLAQLLGTEQDPWLAAICLGLVVVGLVQKYWALRVAFDAELFERLDRLALDELDAALHGLGLLADGKGGRALGERCQGALRLLKRQALLLALQTLLLLGGLIHALLPALPA